MTEKGAAMTTETGQTQRLTGVETRERFMAAIAAVEASVEADEEYFKNNGPITLVYVASIAGLSATTLRNKHHISTRDMLKSKIKALNSLGKAKKGVGRSLTSRSGSLESRAFYENALQKVNAEVIKMRRNYHKMEAELRGIISDKEREISKLRSECSLNSNAPNGSSNGQKSADVIDFNIRKGKYD